ncbi:MAG: tRNA (adenosine(37)-N6)-threonylcarbamoyltransferase complex ATPase subunit type 1 TsaE [Synechococcus sp. SB0668_bin_15]|nr:tRNA (adenosine(37)-N6)-threonylcarbamoyltransferase complex ATPase subunit type 1 TsaE [Synechococcus sp. SB0668_bin_15]MXZ82936.1 tRNA (adenosine(37)-N6)-threonylcarbamoyltransferase complex ATPase subunit type 1 TsaE [Synechococcus sp. SB0666_bin_14]MYC49674.1 tRNA (adenosine(37)-N6)-threonylcarbamoyltransferase complex ATPase subunit type 1 TsaE [Synechococcus sp. SB0662_bin_14]MYG46321.1 tRNA (adenosine(37)-N6)-threonylcarbamoyltransferase complex ATPase subunit type 1 TsaE [Synechococcu
MNPTPLPDARATQAYGRRLARTLLTTGAAGGVVVLLQGPLGAGKTCLVGGIAQALAIGEPVTSPTFALAQHYRGQWHQQPQALVHLDLYRLEQPAAADQLFWEEEELAHEQGALLAVEWPERLSRWPQDAWHLQLHMASRGRLAVLRST